MHAQHASFWTARIRNSIHTGMPSAARAARMRANATAKHPRPNGGAPVAFPLWDFDVGVWKNAAGEHAPPRGELRAAAVARGRQRQREKREHEKAKKRGRDENAADNDDEDSDGTGASGARPCPETCLAL